MDLWTHFKIYDRWTWKTISVAILACPNSSMTFSQKLCLFWDRNVCPPNRNHFYLRVSNISGGPQTWIASMTKLPVAVSVDDRRRLDWLSYRNSETYHIPLYPKKSMIGTKFHLHLTRSTLVRLWRPLSLTNCTGAVWRNIKACEFSMTMQEIRKAPEKPMHLPIAHRSKKSHPNSPCALTLHPEPEETSQSV